MGTSSTLAGAVMAALLRAGGKSCDKKGLIHAVSCLFFVSPSTKSSVGMTEVND